MLKGKRKFRIDGRLNEVISSNDKKKSQCRISHTASLCIRDLFPNQCFTKEKTNGKN